MSVYIDTSALIPLYIPDALSRRANALVAAQTDPLVVSDYAVLEFSASLMRMVRAEAFTAKIAKDAISQLDTWRLSACGRAETTPADIAAADSFVRREDLSLRASDAVNVAIAYRIGAKLLTFDKKLASNAKRLGLVVA